MTPKHVTAKSNIDYAEFEESNIEELSKVIASPFILKVSNNQRYVPFGDSEVGNE